MSAALLMSVAAVERPSGSILLRPHIVLKREVLTLGDVADVSVLPPALRSRAEVLTLAKFPRKAVPAKLATRELLARIRARMPILAAWLPKAFPETLAVTISEPFDTVRKTAAALCLKAVTSVAAGTFPAANGFAAVDCPTKAPKPAFAYDASRRSVKATRPLAPGEIVHRNPGFLDQAVRPGERLMLVSSVGPMRIERSVEALQQAGEGQRVFVKTEDGAILSVAVRRNDR